MIRIRAQNADGEEKGAIKSVTKQYWERLQDRFGKNLRWKEVKPIIKKPILKIIKPILEEEVNEEIKTKKDERTERSVSGDAVEKA